MNNFIFGKTMEDIRNHRDIKLVKSDKRRKRLVSESNSHSYKIFPKHLMAIEMKKTKVQTSMSIYIDMSILDISKTLMHEFWYDYVKPNYGDREKLSIQILIALLFTLKPKIFLKIFLVTLKDDLIHLTLMKMIKDLF